jgi:hypothetical protein
MEDGSEEVQEEVKKAGRNLLFILLIILLVIMWKLLTGTITPGSFMNWNINSSFVQEIKKFIIAKYDWIIGITIVVIALVLLRRSNQQWLKQEKLKQRPDESHEKSS